MGVHIKLKFHLVRHVTTCRAHIPTCPFLKLVSLRQLPKEVDDDFRRQRQRHNFNIVYKSFVEKKHVPLYAANNVNYDIMWAPNMCNAARWLVDACALETRRLVLCLETRLYKCGISFRSCYCYWVRCLLTLFARSLHYSHELRSSYHRRKLSLLWLITRQTIKLKELSNQTNHTGLSLNLTRKKAKHKIHSITTHSSNILDTEQN